METNKLEILKREFNLFEWKVNELEKLNRVLYSLDAQYFEKDIAIIKEKLSSVENITDIKRLIYILKLKIKERKVKSASNVAKLIERILECIDKTDIWNYETLRKQYEYILKKYMELPEEEKIIVYSILSKFHKKIREKDG